MLYPRPQGRLLEIKTKQQEDQACSQVAQYCREGWPAENSREDPDVHPFFAVRDELTLQDGILLSRTRLVIPAGTRKDKLTRTHNSDKK